MRIRAATRDDVPAIARVHVRSWQAAYAGLIDAAFLDALSVTWREDQWHRWFELPPPGLRVWVLEEEGEVVGFASAGPSRDPDARPETAEVYTIYLDPPHVGMGHGRQLFDRMTEELRADGYRGAELWVLEGNARARRFYERAGWRTDGSKKTERFAGRVELHEVRYRTDL